MIIYKGEVECLSDEDRMNLRSEYRKNNMNFKNINSIQELNF